MHFPAAITASHSGPSSILKLKDISAALVTELLTPPENTDHSQTIRELAEKRIWSSIPPENYKPNDKINFLHINDNGTVVITIFKPNTKPRHIYAKITPEEATRARQRLQGMKTWNVVEETGWDNAKGVDEVDGNTYHAHRKVTLGDDGLELHWIVSHSIVGQQVLIADKLLIARGGKVLEEGPDDIIES